MNLTLQDNSSKLVLWVVILRKTPNNKTMLLSEMVKVLIILRAVFITPTNLCKVLIILRAVFITPTNLCNSPQQPSGASLWLRAPMPTLVSVIVIQMAVHQATTPARTQANSAVPSIRAQASLILQPTIPARTRTQANSAILYSSRWLRATTLARVNSAILSSRCLQATISIRARWITSLVKVNEL